MGDPSESSGEEDGNSEWRAAIDSVATSTSSYVSSLINGSSSATSKNDNSMASKRHNIIPPNDADDRRKHKPKHYQLKAQKLLDEILEKSLVMVKDHPIHEPITDPTPSDEGVIRLFKHSTPGIMLADIDEPEQPRKRPKILPGNEIDEKSKKFKRMVQSVAVDWEDIMASARNVCQKSLARLEAKDAAVREAAKREEERVAELKKIRGERWLPSLAKEMKMKSQP